MNIELIGGKGSEAVRLAWYVKQKYLQYEKNIDNNITITNK